MSDHSRTFGPGEVEVVVLTTSVGPLARLGHDLSFRVGRLQLDLTTGDDDQDEDGAAVTAVLQADSLELLSPVNARDRADILQRLRKDVLKPKRWPEIRFSSTRITRHGEGEHARLNVQGDLTLCGTTRPIGFDVIRDRDQWGGQVIIRQPDFGIKPFKIALGSLRIAPEVTLQLRTPALSPAAPSHC